MSVQDLHKRSLGKLAQSKCRSTFHKGHFIRKCAGKIKCCGPDPRCRLCASLHSWNACQDSTRSTLYRNTGKMPQTRTRGADFVRACAIETHVKMSQEPLSTDIYTQNSADQSEHPDQAPAFTPTVRTPQCGHTVWSWGKTHTLLV